jgi:hypothetical protein
MVKDSQLEAIWGINKFTKFLQGTSRNENFHHFLNGKKPPFVGCMSYTMLKLLLDFIVLEWNNGYARIDSNVTLKEGKAI